MSMKWKVMITASCHDILPQRLTAAGYEVVIATSMPYDELLTQLNGVAGIVVSTRLKIDQPVFDAAPDLQWIGRLGSGLELIDLAYAEKKGVKVYSSPEGNSNAVGEHTLALLLNLMHKVGSSAKEVKERLWLRDENRGVELDGKTVGIIGFGHTGSAFAKKLRGFDVTVLAHDKYKFGFGGTQVKEASLQQVLKYSDVISLHLPLTNETFHYANEPFFQMAERKPFFINASRGKVHETAALIDALKKGQIAAAGLDVLENEQLNNYSATEQQQLDWLLSRENVIITPHIAGYSHESYYKLSSVLADKIGI